MAENVDLDSDKIQEFKLRQELLALCERRQYSMLLKYSGLDPDTILDIWDSAHSYLNNIDNLQRNVINLIELEVQLPGAARILYEKYGIAMFGRYPIELLVNQAKNQDSNSEFGYLINPYFDDVEESPGAFFDAEELYKALYQDLQKEGVGLKLIEVANVRDAIDKLQRCRTRFGRADFAIIGSHGNDEKISFGEERDQEMYVKDLGGFANATSLVFSENPRFILDSCATGGKVAQTMARYGAHVTGPLGADTLSRVNVSRDNIGKLILNPHYVYGSKRTYKPPKSIQKPASIGGH